ncbi:MAG: PIN domain-containing protein [Candidatus Njordarchaeales archaeon]
MIRAIIDTNVIFSALYNPRSSPGIILLSAIEGLIKLIAPESVKDEIIQILKEKLEFSDEEAHSIISSLPIEWVEKEVYEDYLAEAREMIRDETDAPLIALHLITNYPIITGDKEILGTELRAYTPSSYIKKLIEEGILEKKRVEEMLTDINKFLP